MRKSTYPTFNITPKPRMLLAVQNQKWTVSGALAELIDNSFGQGRGNAKTVKITYDTTQRTLTVIDDGQGMEYIGRLFQLGNTIGRTVGDIGHFGSGGTQAIIWLPEWVSVATTRNRFVMSDRVRWSDIFEMDDFSDISVSNAWIREKYQHEFSEFTCGTAIHMKLLKTRKISIPNIIRDLSRLFAPGLRHGKRIILCQMQAGELVDEHFLNDPFEDKTDLQNTVHFDIVVEHGDQHLPVRGAISFDDSTSHADSIIRIGFGYREIIRTRDCFKSEKEAFAGIGVSGWLDLGDGWQPYLSTTKDGFDHQPLYETMMSHVFDNIRDLLIKADRRSTDFELDNLAIGLQMALETTMQMKVSVTRGRGNQGGGGGGGDSGSSGSHKTESDPAGGNSAKATAHITLFPQTNDEMMGVLARAGVDPTGIYVDINETHPYVREAMRQRPVNAAALNLMVITEIAALLTSDANLVKAAFKKSVIDDLDQRDGYEKARWLIRYMIDSVPSKTQLAS